MNKSVLLSVFLFSLSLPWGNAQATVVTNDCFEQYPGGIYDPPTITCHTVSQYDLVGTVVLLDKNTGEVASSVIDITGTMTKDSTITDDQIGSSYGNITTTLDFDVPPFGSYHMDQYENYLDGGITPDSFDETILGVYSADDMTLWDITDDGETAFLSTLDGDGDGINGINVYQDASNPLSLLFVADVQLHTVPLPAAFWLFGSGMLALLGFRRKRRG